MCETSVVVLCTGKTLSDTSAQPSCEAHSNTQPSRLDHIIVDAISSSLFSIAALGALGWSQTTSLFNCVSGLWHLTCLPAPPAPILLHGFKCDLILRVLPAHCLQTEHSQSLLAESMNHAHAYQHEQASSAFHASLDAAAKAAGLPWALLQVTACSDFYPWFGPRCATLRLQLRQAKHSLPCSAAVRLLERQYQNELRHSRTSYNRQQVTEHFQLFRTNLARSGSTRPFHTCYCRQSMV